jgi:hypothetical protein
VAVKEYKNKNLRRGWHIPGEWTATGFYTAINGYMFGNMPIMTMKKGQRVRWYLLALGDSNNFHTPHWHGNVVNFHGYRAPASSLSLPPKTFPTNRGICFSLEAILNEMKTLDSGTILVTAISRSSM